MANGEWGDDGKGFTALLSGSSRGIALLGSSIEHRRHGHYVDLAIFPCTLHRSTEFHLLVNPESNYAASSSFRNAPMPHAPLTLTDFQP